MKIIQAPFLVCIYMTPPSFSINQMPDYVHHSKDQSTSEKAKYRQSYSFGNETYELLKDYASIHFNNMAQIEDLLEL